MLSKRVRQRCLTSACPSASPSKQRSMASTSIALMP